MTIKYTFHWNLSRWVYWFYMYCTHVHVLPTCTCVFQSIYLLTDINLKKFFFYFLFGLVWFGFVCFVLLLVSPYLSLSFSLFLSLSLSLSLSFSLILSHSLSFSLSVSLSVSLSSSSLSYFEVLLVLWSYTSEASFAVSYVPMCFNLPSV